MELKGRIIDLSQQSFLPSQTESGVSTHLDCDSHAIATGGSHPAAPDPGGAQALYSKPAPTASEAGDCLQSRGQVPGAI